MESDAEDLLYFAENGSRSFEKLEEIKEEIPENVDEAFQKSPKQEEKDDKKAKEQSKSNENCSKIKERDEKSEDSHEKLAESPSKIEEVEIKLEEIDEDFHGKFSVDPAKLEEQYEKSGVYLGEFPEETLKMEKDQIKMKEIYGDINLDRVELYEEVYAEEDIKMEIKEEIDEAAAGEEEKPQQRIATPPIAINNNNTPQSSSTPVYHIFNYRQPPPKRPIANNRCSLCTRFIMRPALKTIQKTEEKLLIMTAYLIKNHQSLTEARLFIHKTKYKLICRSHFPELLDTIFSAIGVKSIDKIDACSRELKEHLFVLMKSLDANFDTEKFDDVVRDFVKRNFKPEKRSVSPPVTMRRRFPTRVCVICYQTILVAESTSVTARDVRVLLMLGSMLKNEKTLDEAREFLFHEDRCILCQSHFSETLTEIAKHLGMGSFEAIHDGPEEKIDELMVTLKQLNPFFTKDDFHAAVRIFTLRIYNIYNKRSIF